MDFSIRTLAYLTVIDEAPDTVRRALLSAS
jgi:hypothetical protein